MKAKRLLNVLTLVDGQYIEQLFAEEAKPKRHSVKKVWLIAAVIALMLVLVGCVVYVLNLQDLKLTDNPYPDIYVTESTEKTDTISLQGYVDSPNYLAAKEWMEFKKNYDPDNKISQSLTKEEMIMPEEYWSYNCYTPEMTAKIDEICEKYNLVKQGKEIMRSNKKQFFDALQIDGVVREDAKAEIVIHPQYFYKTGTFMLSCETLLLGENTPWNYNLQYQFYCVKKTDFDDVFLNVGDMESYDQWEYTTWNGIKVLLALSHEKALVFVDKEDAFISINVMNPWVQNESFGERMTGEALEAFADTFDFSFVSQPIDDETWEAMNERPTPEEHEDALKSICRESYAERVQYLMENASRPDMLDYALLDVDGDGAEELLIARRQHICCIYTIKGETVTDLLAYPVERYIYSFLWEEDGLYKNPSPMYLCEGNAVACIYTDLNTNRVIYHFAVPVDGKMVWMEEIAWEQNKDGASYYEFTMEEGSAKGYNDICTPISEERYNEVLSTYVRVKLEWTPLSEYSIE